MEEETGKVRVRVDSKYYRPTEVDLLVGDPAKARRKLKWEPTLAFKDLVRLMVTEDLKEEGLDLELPACRCTGNLIC